MKIRQRLPNRCLVWSQIDIKILLNWYSLSTFLNGIRISSFSDLTCTLSVCLIYGIINAVRLEYLTPRVGAFQLTNTNQIAMQNILSLSSHLLQFHSHLHLHNEVKAIVVFTITIKQHKNNYHLLRKIESIYWKLNFTPW